MTRHSTVLIPITFLGKGDPIRRDWASHGRRCGPASAGSFRVWDLGLESTTTPGGVGRDASERIVEHRFPVVAHVLDLVLGYEEPQHVLEENPVGAEKIIRMGPAGLSPA